ncbi:MAG TPA: hypothetical protein VJC15_03445 [Candidatus Paceibacterota bacterium]
MVKIMIEEKAINRLIKNAIRKTLYEIAGDSDFGLDLQEWVKARLRKTPRKLISAEKIKEKYLS